MGFSQCLYIFADLGFGPGTFENKHWPLFACSKSPEEGKTTGLGEIRSSKVKRGYSHNNRVKWENQ